MTLLPSTSDYAGLTRSWRTDLIAGVTVGIVALPLALAFGVTTGLGAAAGLVTAIVAGVLAAIFGGSNLSVSGPTGAMTVVLVPIVARYGTNAVFVVSLMAGVLITIAGIARLGRYIAYIPWPVVEGFTIGIAAIIFLQQVPSALGVTKPEGENAALVAIRALRAGLDWHALALVAIVVAIMLVLPRLHRAIPASLIAVGAATLASLPWDVERIGRLPGSLPLPALPHASVSLIRELLGAAVAVAALGAIESLLCARVADGMTDVPEHDPDRELFGQGIANLVSPLFGGMPATAAIARTAVNVRAGARTRVSALAHAFVLLAIVYFGGTLVGRIPLATLAGVLMVTAVRMVERHNVRAVLRSTRSDAVVLVLTAAATIVFDLVVAVEAGIAIAAFLSLRLMARTWTAQREPVEIDPDAERSLLHDHIVVYRLDGALFFGAAQRFLTELTAVTDVRVVVLRLSGVQLLDATGAHVLGEIVSELEHRGITVLLKGLRPEHRRTLEAVGTLDRLAHENHLFETLPDALEHARTHASRSA